MWRLLPVNFVSIKMLTAKFDYRPKKASSHGLNVGRNKTNL